MHIVPYVNLPSVFLKEHESFQVLISGPQPSSAADRRHWPMQRLIRSAAASCRTLQTSMRTSCQIFLRPLQAWRTESAHVSAADNTSCSKSAGQVPQGVLRGGGAAAGPPQLRRHALRRGGRARAAGGRHRRRQPRVGMPACLPHELVRHPLDVLLCNKTQGAWHRRRLNLLFSFFCIWYNMYCQRQLF